MTKDLLFPIALVTAFLVVPYLPVPSSENSTNIAVVNYGRILFEEAGITAYRPDEYGLLQPSPDLSEEEVETLIEVTGRVKEVIAEICDDYGFSIVIRQADDLVRMQVPV